MTQPRAVPSDSARLYSNWSAPIAALLVVIAIAGCGRDAQRPGRVAASSAAPSVQIRLEQQTDGRFAFVVTGLDPSLVHDVSEAEWNTDRWRSLFTVGVAPSKQDSSAQLAPMLGSYSVIGEDVWFKPRFPLEPGLTYRALFNPKVLAGDVEAVQARKLDASIEDFSIPKPQSKPTKIVHIYPSADTLPENQLKFYIHFSAPMRQGGSYKYLHLIDDSGSEVDYPYLELAEELWDPDGTRFTLYFHPGRIKRGLKPREDVGPALIEGKTYSLRMDADWPDAAGDPLEASVTKTFHVAAPDMTQPDPKTWKITAPLAGSTDAVVVRFPEPLDHALLQRQLWITDSSAKIVEGTIQVDEHETCWRFVPKLPWKAGKHQLVIDTTLEDLAGNSVGRIFDVDVFERIDLRIETETTSRTFRISSAGP